MKDKPYHHGDLKNKLIEAGIELINEDGMNDFSIRKVAAKCGVSHTAPYSHFENIEALNQAMGDHVTGKFMEKLWQSVQNQLDSHAAVLSLGKSYITFFNENPHYYQFIFYHSGLTIDLDSAAENDYQPFVLFRDTAYRMFDDMELAKEDYLNSLLALWSMVHGIVSLLSNKGIHYTGNWSEILTNNLNCGGNNVKNYHP